MEMFVTLLSLTGGEKKQQNNRNAQQHKHIQAINSIFYDGFRIITTNWKLKRHGLY